MWTFLLGPFLALLPERWRRAWLPDAPVDWPCAAMLSGLLEGVGCLLALIGWYLYYIQVAIDQQVTLAAGALRMGRGAGDSLSYAMGLSALTAFAIHPLTWTLAYFWIEGMLRTIAVWTSDEVAGTLPLVLVEHFVIFARRRAEEAKLPRVPDLVTRSDGKQAWDLKVASCRPKYHWLYPLTIRFCGEYFQVMDEGAGGAEAGRPHVYLLRRPPVGEAFRGVEEYDPESVARREEPSPNFLVSHVRALLERHRLRRLPRVADRVQLGDGREGWHLRVESCRPKPHWMHARTIRYEDRLYRVADTFSAFPPRPFGYRLRLLTEGEAARGMVDYSPDEPLLVDGS